LDVERIGRFAGYTLDTLSGEQAASLKRLAQDRGGVPAPHRFLIASPMVVDHIAGLGTAIRRHGDMTLREIELVVLITSAKFGVGFVRETHKAIGVKAGLSAAVMDAVLAGKVPDELPPREKAICELALAVHHGAVGEELSARMTKMLGNKLIAEVIGLMGVYAVTCYALRFVDAKAEEAGNG
jgi:4-carboxymuconolactone decarboxylase